MTARPSPSRDEPVAPGPGDPHIAALVQGEVQRLFDHAAEGLHWLGPDGTILWANQTELALLGYAPEEYIGHNITGFHVDRHAIEDILARLHRGETLLAYNARLRHRNGSVRHVQINSNVLWRDGRFVHTRCFTRDVTDSREADELRARDRFLVALDDTVRPLTDAEEITRTAARALGSYLHVNRCAYATVEADQDSFVLTGDYVDGVPSIVGRYRFRQFGEDCLRLMRAGEAYVVNDTTSDGRITDAERPSYELTTIRAVICVPILKHGRFVAAMAVHTQDPRAWDRAEVELVQHVASRCWESIERARIAMDLLESERQFRDLANSIANLAWMARPDGWIYWFNDQWYAYSGTTPADMEGWGWQRVHDPATLPEVMERWRWAIAQGTPFEMVFPLRAANGSFRRFLTRANPVRDAQGQVLHWFGTNTDVEDERRAMEINELLREREQAARQEAEHQKRLLHALFMQAPTLIAVLRGPDHIVQLANPPVCEVWGRTAAELVERPLFDAMPELQDQVIRGLLDEVYRTGEPYVGKETKVQLARQHGLEAVYFNFVYMPWRNLAGAIAGIFVVASDVTDQVLARTQLEQLREGSDAANRAKDEFLAMLGHELRNPLSPILTALQLMRLRGGDGADRERAVIERQVLHLTRLVDDLLDVSRIARGKVELKEEVIEVADVVARAIEMTSPLLEERAHTLTVEIPRQGLRVRGDAMRLAQVAANLLTNAAKYTGPGGRIDVAAGREAADVTLRVRDSGIGISADVLPRIFDLFVQESQALDRARGGLGLGLSIVRSLVERHGGSVDARSDGPGCGSEFVVRLPAVEATGEQARTAPDPRRAVRQKDAQRILLVDDNQDAAVMLAELLLAAGHQVRIAHDAPSALHVAREFAPDVAILDIGLPVMDGYELAVHLRRLPELEMIRCIAVTGYGQDADRKRSQSAGFCAHLVKPVDIHAVDAVLRK